MFLNDHCSMAVNQNQSVYFTMEMEIAEVHTSGFGKISYWVEAGGFKVKREFSW